MSRVENLSKQVSNLSRELSLSTFLNKGILQSNEEQKLRIVELEKENSVLRIAESQLARTEDELESMEVKLKATQEELRRRQREWERDMQMELKERERIEGERDEWKGRFERLRHGFEAQRKVFQEVEKEEEKDNGAHSVAESSTNVRSATRRKSVNQSQASPSVTPIKPLHSMKRRRRVNDSSSQEPEGYDLRKSTSLPVPQKPPNPYKYRPDPIESEHSTKNAQLSSTTKRRSIGRPSDPIKVKDEPLDSPESDDDPLAM